MANSRRALQRKGNVFDIADARKKRDNIVGSSRSHEGSEHGEDDTAVLEQPLPAGSSSLERLAQTNAKAPPQKGTGQTDSGMTASSETVQARSAASQQQTAPGQSPNAQSATQSAAGTPKASTTKKSAASGKRDHGNRTFNYEKVEAIKAAIANGSYEINPQRIADKFIEREAPA